MELIYNLRKYTNPIIKWKNKTCFISVDELSYGKNDKDGKSVDKRYHITQVRDIYIAKEKDGGSALIIEVFPKEEIKFSYENEEEGKIQFYKIKNTITAYKILYHMKLLKYSYDKSIQNASKEIEYKKQIDQYLSHELYDDKVKLLQEKKSNLDIKSKEAMTAINDYVTKINSILEAKKINEQLEQIEDFEVVIPEQNEPTNTESNLKILSEGVDTMFNMYNTLLSIFCDIKQKEILAKHMSQDLSKSFSTVNSFSDESKVDAKLNEAKKEKEELTNKLLELLNKNNQFKEKFKKLQKAKNIKLYFCPQCNYILDKTVPMKASCKLHHDCTTKSFFFCQKCKINYCTLCVVYQRNGKCSKNHSYFYSKFSDPSQVILQHSQEEHCFLCDSTTARPFYACNYCNECLCGKCMKGQNGKTNNCYNCNGELTWRKRIYSQCNKCMKWKDCFWYCCICDYYLCIECYPNTKGFCGSMHEVEMFNLDKERRERTLDGRVVFKNNYEMGFLGKCSRCNHTIKDETIAACLRCTMFLCTKCQN